MGQVAAADSVYAKLRPLLSAPDLIRRLGLEESRTLGDESHLRPLCHESTSGESLHVNLSTGAWLCRACGFGGDLIQLAEYALSGGQRPSHGTEQTSSTTHRRALEWLCSELGVPWDPSKARRTDFALDALHAVAMSCHRYLLDERADVLEWIDRQWGFDRATVEGYGLGFMPSPALPEIVRWATETERPAMRSTGIGWVRDGRYQTRFEGRVLFPYLENGRAVYLIGRATPWTPDVEVAPGERRKPPKYHKLSVHSERHPHISPSISNDHLYLERVLTDARGEIAVTEGVADAVALSSIGVQVVSPVTISFNATDIARFAAKCRENQISTVSLIFDNEASGSGVEGAWRSAEKLVERGLRVFVVTLPRGPEQEAAYLEVCKALGDDVAEFERADPRERKRLLERAIPDAAARAWISEQAAASKVDAAEFVRQHGAAANEMLRSLRAEAVDVILRKAEESVIEHDDPAVRADAMEDVIALAARLASPEHRGEYAGKIAKLCGKGVTKAAISSRMAAARKRAQAEASQAPVIREPLPALVVDPPMPALPSAPPQPVAGPKTHGAAAPPPPPSPHGTRFETWRSNVLEHIRARSSDDVIGAYCAGNIKTALGFTPFRTPEGVVLVRRNERLLVGSTEWKDRLSEWFGLVARKGSHAGAIGMAQMHVGLGARKVRDVSWSYVERDVVYFPTGDDRGSIVRIEPGQASLTLMSAVNVPAVAGSEFMPFTYSEADGGIRGFYDLLAWTSLPEGERLLLTYWTACLPVLRLIGTIPIMRIEGGSSSGKTRVVEAVSQLVNGQRGSSVPTASALASRMAVSMLTVDDNRERIDISRAYLSTLLQATHLGAREKRRGNSDTETVVERIAGALLMSGIEPIHDGRPELASRILPLRCDPSLRAADSPESVEALLAAVGGVRDRFWSEATRACARALELDREHGERLGGEIDQALGDTRMGRTSAYLRMMYLAWAASLAPDAIGAALARLDPGWAWTLARLGDGVTRSLIADEVACSCIRAVFDLGARRAEASGAYRTAFDGAYVADPIAGWQRFGPRSASRLARLAREAAKELNSYDSVRTVTASQLDARLLDSWSLIVAAGYEPEVHAGKGGRAIWTFTRRQEIAGELQPSETGDANGWLT